MYDSVHLEDPVRHGSWGILCERARPFVDEVDAVSTLAAGFNTPQRRESSASPYYLRTDAEAAPGELVSPSSDVLTREFVPPAYSPA